MREQLIIVYSYLHGIWRYRWSALVIAWIVALLGWAVVYTLPNTYMSQATLHIDTRSVMKPLLEGLTVETDVQDALAIMSRILLSRESLEAVIRETDLDLRVSNSQGMDRLVREMAGSIILKEGNKSRRQQQSNIYELSYQGDSAELVYQVVSKLLNNLIENTLNSARTDTAAAEQFLDRQISEYETRLTVAEQRLADFKRTNIGFMPDEKGGYYSRLQREQGELDSLRSELELAKRKLAEMRKQLKSETPMLDGGGYGSARTQKLRNYKQQLESLLTQYTEQHPDVQALRATIADLLADESSIDEDIVDLGEGDSLDFNPVYQELKAEIHKTSVEVETIKIRVTEKERGLEELKKSIDVIPEVEAELAKLNRDYEITRGRYLDLVERRESARLAQEVGQSGSNVNFRIIDPPRISTKPSGPNRLLLLTAVLLASLAAGLGWGFLRYLIQPTFIEASQIKARTGIPVLGAVGLYLTAKHRRKRRLQFSLFTLVFFLLIGVFLGALLYREPGSQLARLWLSQIGVSI